MRLNHINNLLNLNCSNFICLSIWMQSLSKCPAILACLVCLITKVCLSL